MTKKKTRNGESLNEVRKALANNPDLTTTEISKITGISTNSILSMSYRGNIDLKNKRATRKPINLKQVKELCKTMSVRQMHKEIDVGYERLSKFLKENGLKANTQWYAEGLKSGEIQHWMHKVGKVAESLNKVKKKDHGITNAKNIVWPESVNIQVYKRPSSDDPRNVMAAPVWNPNKRNFLGNYA